MQGNQPLEGQTVGKIPTIEVTDYSTDTLDYQGPTTRARTSVASSSSSKASSRRRQGDRASKSISDSPRDAANMSSSSFKSSKKHGSSTSDPTLDEWADISDPEERRRRQNRKAQRKFRQKAKELKDQAQREAVNRQLAGSSYHVPEPAELPADSDCPGLPWGSFSMPYIIGRGHESASQQSSRRTSQPQMAITTSPEQPITSPEYLTSPFSDTHDYNVGYNVRDAGSSGDEHIMYQQLPGLYAYQGAGTGQSPEQEYGHHYQH